MSNIYIFFKMGSRALVPCFNKTLLNKFLSIVWYAVQQVLIYGKEIQGSGGMIFHILKTEKDSGVVHIDCMN